MCSTAKKVAGAAPGYAICVVNLKSIQYFSFEDLYYLEYRACRCDQADSCEGSAEAFQR